MLLSLTPTEQTGETRVRPYCLNVNFSNAYKLKNKFWLEKEGVGIEFCGISDTAAVQDRRKFPT